MGGSIRSSYHCGDDKYRLVEATIPQWLRQYLELGRLTLQCHLHCMVHSLGWKFRPFQVWQCLVERILKLCEQRPSCIP